MYKFPPIQNTMDSSPRNCLQFDRENEENSPECLLPVKDPYSSDDDKHEECKKNGPSLRQKILRNEKKDFTLFEKMDSQDIRPEQSHFFFSIDYQPMDEEITLEDKSLEDCLHEIFKFVQNDSFDKGTNTWKGRFMTETIENESSVSWLIENDAINWKTASVEEKETKQKLYNKISCDYENCRHYFPQLCVAEAAMDVYYELMMKTHSVDGDKRHIERQNVLETFMETVGSCVDSSNFMQNRKCEEDIVLYIPQHLASDESSLIPQGRRVTLTVKPDAVFTYRLVSTDRMYRMKHWLLVLQVHGHFAADPIPSQNSSSTKAASKSKSTKQKSSSSTTSSSNNQSERSTKNDNPEISVDKLLDTDYISCVKKYIDNSLPAQCRGLCVEKMAGEHAIHLLCLAKKQFSTRDYTQKKMTLSVCGLFMVNEFIYFTRLNNIEEKFLRYLLYDEAREQYSAADINFFTSEYKSLRRPVFSCSNWRLDITIANHRLALLIFLSQYIQTATQEANR